MAIYWCSNNMHKDIHKFLVWVGRYVQNVKRDFFMVETAIRYIVLQDAEKDLIKNNEHL